MTLVVEGTLTFSANGKRTEVIEDSYDIRIEAPERFPDWMALAWETAGRIPSDYHKLTNGALCLGSRVGLRLQMGGSSSLLRFVERCVIPYLYGYSYAVKHGAPPFGELAHGELGSLQDLAGLLGVEDLALAARYCTLATRKRRRANKQLCPCGSGRRLGRCHNRKVNALRKRVGRAVLASEMRTIAMAGLLDGYRAATHWAFYEPLAALGVEACHERVTVDRNRITGGGVTAGVDFGLTVVAELKGQDQAEFTQLALEYCPQPPFNAGHPSTARQEIIDMISGPKGIMGEMTPQGVAIATAHKQRLAATLANIAPAANAASA